MATANFEPTTALLTEIAVLADLSVADAQESDLGASQDLAELQRAVHRLRRDLATAGLLADRALAVINGHDPEHGFIRGGLMDWLMPGPAHTLQKASS